MADTRSQRIPLLPHAGLAPAKGLEHDFEIYLIALMVGAGLYLALSGGRVLPPARRDCLPVQNRGSQTMG